MSKMKMKTDEQLWRLIQAGKIVAFDELYRRYEQKLFFFIFRYLRHKEEAEEVFHDAFMKVLKNESKIFEQNRFEGWIFMTARNMCIDLLRRKSTGTRLLAELRGGQENMFETNGLDNDIQLKKAFTKLPIQLQKVFQLKMKGLSHLEISETLKVPVGTIKSRVHTMVSILKKEMNGG